MLSHRDGVNLLLGGTLWRGAGARSSQIFAHAVTQYACRVIVACAVLSAMTGLDGEETDKRDPDCWVGTRLFTYAICARINRVCRFKSS